MMVLKNFKVEKFQNGQISAKKTQYWKFNLTLSIYFSLNSLFLMVDRRK